MKVRKNGKLETIYGVYTPQSDETWVSMDQYRHVEGQLSDALEALEKLQAKELLK